MKTTTIITCLTLFLFLGQSQVFAQVSYTYTHRNGNETNKVWIKESNGDVVDCQLYTSASNQWNKTTILSVDYDRGYLRIRSNVTNRTYELSVGEDGEKITMVKPEGTKIIYWLE